MKWVTREHPNTDRIACPWLILRFEGYIELPEHTGPGGFDHAAAR